MSVKCLIYCSKAKPYLRNYPFDLTNSVFQLTDDSFNALNGKIVASFDCEEVEEFTMDYRGNEEQNKRIVKDSCVPLGDLVDYQKENHLLYAIHISNLEIFDEPKELYEYDIKPEPFKTFDDWFITNITYSCTKAPQNMCNVYDSKENHYVLISIRPEWVCKILNGEKTIEVRKSVVNALKGLI